MTLKYLANAFFALTAFAMAQLLWYSQLASNGSMLGDAPGVGTYLGLAYLSIPLLIAAACAFFIPYQNLRWKNLVMVAFGAYADFMVGPSLLSLLIDPYCLVVTWLLGIRAIASVGWRAVPVALGTIIVALAITVKYAEFIESQAADKAQQFCASTDANETLQHLLARTDFEVKHPGFARWVQVFESVKQGDGSIRMSYRGLNLNRTHQCVLTVSGGVVVHGAYEKR